eukprot:Phypoly_transcript_11303.p1 GENE.Phypoly_transcript_11303~~Phypoly_transcript_11303.p1  ORF type:complete len:347 (+),score=53.93 Phypoly_transcript_11303:121-1161(+)
MSKRRFTQNFASKEEEEDTRLNVFYCLHCGSFSLILDTALSSLPRRRTDGSYVLEEAKILRKNMREGDVKVVKRVNGLERQYRLECPECLLFMAYRPNDHNDSDGKLMYILPDAIGTRQELTGAIKHHSIDELRGQMASLLNKFPNGVLLSALRNLFQNHFAQDLDEREYGDYSSLENLIVRALPDIARLDPLMQAVSDMLVLPITMNENTEPENQNSSDTNVNTNSPNTSTENQISPNTSNFRLENANVQTTNPQATKSQTTKTDNSPPQSPNEQHIPLIPLDEIKLPADPNAPKPKPTDLIFQEKNKPTPLCPRVTIKVKPKAKQPTQKPALQPMVALVSSDYD